MSLKGRVAIVSGATGAIGTVTVRALAAAGAKIVLAALDGEALAALTEEASRSGWETLSFATDVTDRRRIDAMVAAALERFGRIDILVNLAGVGARPSLMDSTDGELEAAIVVNLLGAARLMHAVLPVMKAQRGGSIVNVGSIVGEVGVMGIYSASQFGLRGLTDSVRREVRSLGIDVSLIEAGFVRSPMNASMGDKLPSPEVVARAVLASVARPRRRRIVPGSYRLPIAATKLFPGIFERVLSDERVQERLNQD